jgi:hypothetical protein
MMLHPMQYNDERIYTAKVLVFQTFRNKEDVSQRKFNKKIKE